MPLFTILLKSGLTLETMMLATERFGTFNKILLEVLPTRAIKGDFSPGFRAALALKDQRLAIGLAEEIGTHAPVGRAVEKLLSELAASDRIWILPRCFVAKSWRTDLRRA